MQTVIVRYEGALAQSVEREIPGATTVELFNEYGVVTIPDGQLETLRALPEVEYIELPKRLYFDLEQGRRVSCLSSATLPDQNVEGLQGKGVLVGIIDSGIDYSHPDFIRDDGTSRIAFCWDQSEEQEGRAPEGFSIGVEYTAEDFDKALRMPEESRWEIVAVDDRVLGHGTAVAGVAAGNGRGSVSRRNRGIASESDLIIVKLAGRDDGFPRTTEVMEGLDYVLRKAIRLQQPIAVNLSFGNNYGSHSGNSLIETYLDDMANYWKTSIVIGSGNEGSAAVHTAGKLTLNEEQEVEIAVSAYEASLNLQIWKNYVDEIGVYVIHPGGTAIGPLKRLQGTQRFQLGETNLLVYYGEPSPYNPYQEIYLDFIPVGSYIDDGIWKIRLTPIRITDGAFDMWLPAGNVLNSGTGFLNPVEETTLTIPSTATKVITVGAYDARFDQAAAFSGRGYTRATNQVKPDLVAPGVEIMSCAPGGGYQVRTGTSMATPFVTGSAALLMQWGITDGNDAYLYGEKMKAYLIRGARRLPGFTAYPNPVLGWGALCTADSIP